MDISKELVKHQDETYRLFQLKLNPTVDPTTVIGVRMPMLRKLARQIDDPLKFMHQLPHPTFEENMLHSLLLHQLKEVDDCLEELARFVGYMDNWAVVDACYPKALLQDKAKSKLVLLNLFHQEHEFTVRCAINNFMHYFLDDIEIIELVSQLNHPAYYVKMMQAWFMCEGFIQFPALYTKYFKEAGMPEWVLKKAIAKCLESNRVHESQKLALRQLRSKIITKKCENNVK